MQDTKQRGTHLEKVPVAAAIDVGRGNVECPECNDGRVAETWMGSNDGTHIIAVQCLHTSVRNEALMSTVLKRFRIPHTIGSLRVV